MNSRVTNILIVLSLGILLTGYYFKIRNRHSDTDELQQQLAGLSAVLPPTAAVHFNCRPENLETFMQARYLLAPRVLLYTTDTTADTLFRLLPAAMPVPTGNIIWQRSDGRFHYLLIVKPH